MKRNNKERKHTFIPKEFEREYEAYLMREEGERLKKEYDILSDKLDEKAGKLRERREEFLNSVSVGNIDHNLAKKECEEKQSSKINDAINRFLQKNKISPRDLGIKQIKGGKVQIDYINEDGEPISECFTINELLNMDLEYNGDQQE